MNMTNFDAWVMGFQSAVAEIKSQCINLRSSDANPLELCDSLIDFCQHLDKQATTKAPTLEVVTQRFLNTDEYPEDC